MGLGRLMGRTTAVAAVARGPYEVFPFKPGINVCRDVT